MKKVIKFSNNVQSPERLLSPETKTRLESMIT